MILDIRPIVTSGMVLQLLEGPKIIIADNQVDQDRELDESEFKHK